MTELPTAHLSAISTQLTVQNRTRLVDEDIDVYGFVLRMCALRREQAPSNSVLFQFADTREIYQLNIHTGQRRLVASPQASPHSDALPIPALEGIDYGHLFYSGRANVGYAYRFVPTSLNSAGCLRCGGTYEMAPAETLVLIDRDLDGTIDSWQLPPAR